MKILMTCLYILVPLSLLSSISAHALSFSENLAGRWRFEIFGHEATNREIVLLETDLFKEVNGNRYKIYLVNDPDESERPILSASFVNNYEGTELDAFIYYSLPGDGGEWLKEGGAFVLRIDGESFILGDLNLREVGKITRLERFRGNPFVGGDYAPPSSGPDLGESDHR